MTQDERELLLIVAGLAGVNLDGHPETYARLRELAIRIRDDASPPAPVHPMPDPDMEPPKAPHVSDLAEGKELDAIAARNGVCRRLVVSFDGRSGHRESDADLRVRVLDAIARASSAPDTNPYSVNAMAALLRVRQSDTCDKAADMLVALVERCERAEKRERESTALFVSLCETAQRILDNFGKCESDLAAARDFLASLPRPAVVTVPIEPGEGDVETMARAAYERRHRGLKNCWSWDSDGLDREHPGQRALCLEQARAAYRALVKRHGG